MVIVRAKGEVIQWLRKYYNILIPVILSVMYSRSFTKTQVSFAAVFWDSIAWHPKKRLRRRPPDHQNTTTPSLFLVPSFVLLSFWTYLHCISYNTLLTTHCLINQLIVRYFTCTSFQQSLSIRSMTLPTWQFSILPTCNKAKKAFFLVFT